MGETPRFPVSPLWAWGESTGHKLQLYLTIRTKDPSSEQILERVSKDWALLVCPEVCLEHMLQHSGIVNHDGSTQAKHAERPNGAILFMEEVMELRDPVHGCANNENEVADEGQTLGAGKLGATRADGIVSVFDEYVQKVETEGCPWCVAAIQTLKDQAEGSRGLCSLSEVVERNIHFSWDNKGESRKGYRTGGRERRNERKEEGSSKDV